MSKSQTDKLHEVFKEYGCGVDIDICLLYEKITGHIYSACHPRVAQQRVGGVISRLNANLTGEMIVPGRLKRSYRLEKQEG